MRPKRPFLPLARLRTRCSVATLLCVQSATEAELQIDPVEQQVHGRALALLQDAGMAPMVGGAYAMRAHAGLWRDTKDLDLFLRKDRVGDALELLARAGYRTEMTDPMWIAKAFAGPYFIDLIFSSGNGIGTVDEEWERRASRATVLDREALIVPAEEMIWQKGYIQERERFDGADIHHLLRCRGAQLDWRHILDRFGDHWPVLLGHLVTFRFAFPSDKQQVPSWVMKELTGRLSQQEGQRPPADAPCGRGLALLLRQPPGQLLHHPRRHLLLVGGEGEAERDEVAEQDRPVVAEPIQDVAPVELRAPAAQQVVDVRAVEAFPLLDVPLLPDHLLGRDDERLPVEDRGARGPPFPFLVDGPDAVARGEDEVDEVRPGERLRDPHRVGHLGAVPGPREQLQGVADAILAQEQVEVLGVAPQPGVRAHRVRAAHHRSHARILQQREGAAVHLLLDGVDLELRLGRGLHAGQGGDGAARPQTREGERRAIRPQSCQRRRSVRRRGTASSGRAADSLARPGPARAPTPCRTRSGWQCGQKYVLRPPCTMRSICVPQLEQGSPARS